MHTLRNLPRWAVVFLLIGTGVIVVLGFAVAVLYLVPSRGLAL